MVYRALWGRKPEWGNGKTFYRMILVSHWSDSEARDKAEEVNRG